MTGPAALVHTEVMEFGPLAIQFDERVLRPRRWTTAQSAWASEMLRRGPEGPVLELCAGVGHIGLLAVAGVTRPLVLMDANEAACDHAAVNVKNSGSSGPVDIRCGLMHEVLEDAERFALVIADPPWVPSEETSRFPQDPLIAIDGGPDGLDLARMCLALIGRHLAERGSALMQLGTLDQVGAVESYLIEHPELGLGVAEVRVFGTDGMLVALDRF
ncbi:methyltransferase [Aeromicrobium sp.]|uniref:methyltransferase n=1 Tax=Aeromicrobium sp. TaxID=1871063 RepID=UPI0030BE1D1A